MNRKTTPDAEHGATAPSTPTANRTQETITLAAELASFRTQMDRYGFLLLDSPRTLPEADRIWREEPDTIIALRSEPYTGEDEPEFNETVIYDIYVPALSLKAVKSGSMSFVPAHVISTFRYGLPPYMGCVPSADPYALCAVEYVAGYNKLEDELNAQIAELCLRFGARYASKTGGIMIEHHAKAGSFEMPVDYDEVLKNGRVPMHCVLRTYCFAKPLKEWRDQFAAHLSRDLIAAGINFHLPFVTRPKWVSETKGEMVMTCTIDSTDTEAPGKHELCVKVITERLNAYLNTSVGHIGAATFQDNVTKVRSRLSLPVPKFPTDKRRLKWEAKSEALDAACASTRSGHHSAAVQLGT